MKIPLRPRTRTCAACAGAAFLLSLLSTAGAAESAPPRARPSLGLLATDASDSSLAALGDSELGSFYVRLVADWPSIEAEDGTLNWGALDSEIDRLHRASARVVLVLTGAHPKYVKTGRLPSPFDTGALEAWTSVVRAAVSRYGGRIDTLEIWDRGVDGSALPDVETYAFLLKRSSVAARAEADARGVTLRVAQMAIGGPDLDWQKALWELDAAAYADVLPVSLEVDANGPGTASVVGAVLDERLRHPPAVEVWVAARPARGADPWLAACACIEALVRGASVALVGMSPGDPPQPELARWAAGAHRLLGDGFGPATLGGVRFEDATGRPRKDAAALGAFLDDEAVRTLLFYFAPGAVSQTPTERMILDSSFVLGGRLIDPLTGSELRVGSSAAGDLTRRSLRITTAPYPMAVLYERPASTAGFDVPTEAVETVAQRELTAEEIIARYQQVQKQQDDRLERWMARGRIDYHFRFVQGGSTIDVSIDTHYFWERGGELEWEESDYYINGNLVPWKHFPQIPLIQPEKVITLPLDLTLDRTYRYRLVGRDKVEGREAYVLEFQPADAAAPASLYRGRVWIDTERFDRVKASLVQTQLESPVLSNEEIDRYGLQVDADGNEFRLLGQIDGQQVWNTAGRNFVVRREVTFLEYSVNPPAQEFESRRAQAYASENNMMRDTQEGFRYLDRQPDGTRALVPPRTNQWFAALGAFGDSSTSGAQPFAGANYFDFDLAGSKIQFNALLGGVVNFVTASKPDLAGGDLSLTGDLFASALFFEDKVFVADEELLSERMETRSQYLNVRLGWHTAPFVKLNLTGALTFQQYSSSAEGNEAIDRYNQSHGPDVRFELPQDHAELSAGVEIEANRRGYSVVAGWEVTQRTGWEPWGTIDDTSGSFVAFEPSSGLYVPVAPPPVEETFVRFRVDAFKEWYLPSFQKLRTEINYLDGSKLDRFSQYQFSLFGDDRLSGFAGTGVRFDRGVIARAGYSFNLFEVIRLDGLLENAWIRNDEAFEGTHSFTGAGLAANVVGPWKTVFSASYGRALVSDIPELEGSDEFFVLILKLF